VTCADFRHLTGRTGARAMQVVRTRCNALCQALCDSVKLGAESSGFEHVPHAWQCKIDCVAMCRTRRTAGRRTAAPAAGTAGEPQLLSNGRAGHGGRAWGAQAGVDPTLTPTLALTAKMSIQVRVQMFTHLSFVAIDGLSARAPAASASASAVIMATGCMAGCAQNVRFFCATVPSYLL